MRALLAVDQLLKSHAQGAELRALPLKFQTTADAAAQALAIQGPWITSGSLRCGAGTIQQRLGDICVASVNRGTRKRRQKVLKD